MKGMTKVIKYPTLFLLILLTSVMFMLTTANAQDEDSLDIIPPDEQYPMVPNPYNPPIPPASPLETAIVVVAASVGGTTNLAPGAYTANYGDTITLRATASTGYRLLYWSIKGSYTPGHNQPPINYPANIDPTVEDPAWTPSFPDAFQGVSDSLITSTNPYTVICGYGYTYVYQPVFTPTTPATATTDAIVMVLDSLGGNTNPTPGTYYYSNGTTINLLATPDSGYSFLNWVAVGEDGHPTVVSDNPANIDCGYGYTYSYQPMFAPSDAIQSPTGIPTEYFYAIIAILAIIAVIALALVVMYRGKIKK